MTAVILPAVTPVISSDGRPGSEEGASGLCCL